MDNLKETPSPGLNLADETGEEATQRENLPQRIERLSKAKASCLSISDYIKVSQPDHLKLGRTLSDCGNWLRFREYYTADRVLLSGASFCRKHLLCQLCAIRRGAKMVKQKSRDFDQVITDNPNLVPYLMTITIKDGSDLKERTNHITKHFRAFMKRRHLKNRGNEAEKIKGAVWSYEIKRGSNSGLWHPHVHALILVDIRNLVSQSLVSKEWHKLTGDSFIVDIRPIKHDTDEEKINAFCEVFKYALKFSEQPPEDTFHCFDTLKNRRLIGSCGLLYGVKEPLSLEDDVLDDLPYIEHFYSYSRQSGYSLGSPWTQSA